MNNNIESKKCSKCYLEKPLSDFHKIKSKSGYRSSCKLCHSIYNANLNIKNKDKIKIRNKKYYENNKKEIIEKNKLYIIEHPEIKKLCKDNFKENNPNYQSEYNKQYYINNREDIYTNLKEKRNTDIIFSLTINLRNRLYQAIKNNQKVGSAVKNLGCSIEFLKQYLESKFYINKETNEQMNWKNYGLNGWHIDHIKPLSSFNLTNIDEFLKACHYTNLQPMWAKENIKKGNKYE